MEVDINDICRACLTHEEGMLSLYDIYEHDLTLAAILKSCLNTEVYEGDGFPSHLCDNCILVLTQFYNFMVIYEESETQLKNVLQRYEVKQENNDLDNSASVDEQIHNQPNAEDEHEYEFVENVQCESEEKYMTRNGQESYNADNITEMFQCQEGDEGACIKMEAIEVSLSPSEEFQDSNSNFPHEENEESNDHVPQRSTRYECKLCGEVYLYEHYYIAHMQVKHNKTFNTNNNNNNGNIKKNQVEEHRLDSETDSKEFSHLTGSTSNEVKFKDPTLQEITKFECDICGEAYLYQSSFQSHMRIKHQKDDINAEDYCTKFYIKIQPKPERNYSRSYEDIQAPPDRPFACDQCPRRFRHAYMLEHHKEVHSDKKKYVCDVCGKGFVRKTYLDDHMEGHSTVKRHVCKFCGKAFQRRTVLRAHKRTHTHPNYYVCELCGRGFTSTSTLKTHTKLIHIRERNFKCVICSQTFPLKSTLAKHIRRHLNKNKVEKDFPCNQCEMQYRDKSSLKRHIEIKHLGKAVIASCPDCPKKYTSKANLMKHRRRHHLDE